MELLRRRSLLLLLLIALPGRAAHGAPAGDIVDPFIHLPWSPTGAKAGSRFGDAVAPAGTSTAMATAMSSSARRGTR